MTEYLASERERLAREGMYRPEFEGDACGVGLVAATDGKASRRVVTAAIDALNNNVETTSSSVNHSDNVFIGSEGIWNRALWHITNLVNAHRKSAIKHGAKLTS